MQPVVPQAMLWDTSTPNASDGTQDPLDALSLLTTSEFDPHWVASTLASTAELPQLSPTRSGDLLCEDLPVSAIPPKFPL